MSRPPRICVPDITYHVVQRGNDRRATFFEPNDYELYLALLSMAARRYETAVHAYVLMTNHVHLLMTSSRAGGVSRTLQYVGGQYVAKLNERRGRSGTLWEGRFRSSPVASDGHCLACYRYIELNPVRAGIVDAPVAYGWSSYTVNALGRTSWLIVPHATFLALGTSPEQRRARYREMVAAGIDTEEIGSIRHGALTGLPVGPTDFRQQIERLIDRRLGTGRAGRPTKRDTNGL